MHSTKGPYDSAAILSCVFAQVERMVQVSDVETQRHNLTPKTYHPAHCGGCRRVSTMGERPKAFIRLGYGGDGGHLIVIYFRQLRVWSPSFDVETRRHNPTPKTYHPAHCEGCRRVWTMGERRKAFRRLGFGGE